MKKYMQTAGNPVPFQEVVEMSSMEWEDLQKIGLTPYIGKTIIVEGAGVAYYVLDDKRGVKFTLDEFKG